MSNKKLTPEKQFILYYDRLRAELNRAYTQYEISKTLEAFISTRRSEFSKAITFFQLTIYSNLYATIMSICRFIDKRRDSLHLDNFFKFIKDNLYLFSSENYRRRLLDEGRDTEDCEHWVKLHQEITADMVDQDKAKIESLPIKNLMIWRHKKLAHIERELVIEEINVVKEYPIKIQEIDDILVTLHCILNRYRIAYDGVEWVLGLPSPKHQITCVFDAISHYRQSKK